VSALSRPWVRAGLVLGAVLLADQLTKAWVVESLRRGEEDPIFPALKLVNVRNEGVAFGIEAGGQTLIVVLIAVALLALVIYFSRHLTKPLMWLPVGLLLGGALGNIIDRIRIGAVVDFLKLPAWPAFNLADMSITVGVLSLIYVLERRDPDRDPDSA
jgi:signal peptidase II